MIENGTDVQKRPCGPGQLQFGFCIETGVFCHNISFLRVGDINNCSICCKSFGAVCLRGKYLWGNPYGRQLLWPGSGCAWQRADPCFGNIHQ